MDESVRCLILEETERMNGVPAGMRVLDAGERGDDLIRL